MSTTTATEPGRRSQRAPWLGVGLTVVVLVVATTLLGRPAAASPAGAAWLPPDGHRGRLASSLGVAAVEWSRPTPLALGQSAPAAFWTWAQVSAVPWDSATFLRSRSHLLDAAGAAVALRETVWVLGPDGARVALDVAPAEELIFEPGLLSLPADLAVGGSWDSTGELALRSPGGEWAVHTYQASLRAGAPADPALAGAGCVTLATALVFAGGTRDSEQTWCPARGIVAGRDRDTGWEPATAGPVPPPPAPRPFDWARADQLSFVSRSLNQTGPGITHVSPVSPPGLLPGGEVVFSNQLLPDLLALDPGPDPAPVVWTSKPGGTPTAAASVGGFSVVATTDRRLVAYGPDGQWFWEMPLSDIARVAPVALGRILVVATLDGRVTGFDLAGGAEAWRVEVPAEVRTPLAVAGDRVLVADQSGALTCLDATGTQLWTVDAGTATTIAVSAGPDPVVVVARRESSVVAGYALADGTRVWQIRHDDEVRDLVPVGRRLLLRDTERSTAIDAATGAPAWTWSQAPTWAAAGGGERVLLLAATELVLLDAEGRLVRRWPHALGDLSLATGHLAAAEDRVVAYGPRGMSVGSLP